jgi:hypothetical protein
MCVSYNDDHPVLWASVEERPELLRAPAHAALQSTSSQTAMPNTSHSAGRRWLNEASTVVLCGKLSRTTNLTSVTLHQTAQAGCQVEYSFPQCTLMKAQLLNGAANCSAAVSTENVRLCLDCVTHLALPILPEVRQRVVPCFDAGDTKSCKFMQVTYWPVLKAGWAYIPYTRHPLEHPLCTPTTNFCLARH